MNKFSSLFAERLESALCYREALGRSRKAYEYLFRNLDRFCLEHFPQETNLSKELVLKWMERKPGENNGIQNRASAIRYLGKYLDAMGIGSAYILPKNFISCKSTFSPYILMDGELRTFFTAADNLSASDHNPYRHIIAPVIFRLIYTCGLRPNEGRELKRRHIRFDTGEILIAETKHYKERVVVMSDDMLKLCIDYDNNRAALFPESEYFFPHWSGTAYSNQWLSRTFKMCWGMANPGASPKSLPPVRVYDLRHRFASATLNRWLDEKKDLYAMLPYLKTYMGHEDLSATAYYIHILPENLLKSAGVDWRALNALIPEVETCPE